MQVLGGLGRSQESLQEYCMLCTLGWMIANDAGANSHAKLKA